MTDPSALPLRVVMLPALLTEADLLGRAVVVFDVLRATTSIASMFASGAAEVRVFGTIGTAQAAAGLYDGKKLLAGEVKTLPPPGFDLGNSPGGFTADRCGGATIFFSTTNGTAALVAAESAAQLLTCALVNRTATAAALIKLGLPITLLCSGSEGQISTEDVLGCGALIDALGDGITLANDSAQLSIAAWRDAQPRLLPALRETYGGHNIRRNKLDADIEFAASVDRFDLTVHVHSGEAGLVARRG